MQMLLKKNIDTHSPVMQMVDIFLIHYTLGRVQYFVIIMIIVYTILALTPSI